MLLLTVAEALLTSKCKVTLASIWKYCSHVSDNCSKSHTANIRKKRLESLMSDENGRFPPHL